MKTIYDNWPFWQRLLNMLENEFGNRCELILHDLTRDYAHTVVISVTATLPGAKSVTAEATLAWRYCAGKLRTETGTTTLSTHQMERFCALPQCFSMTMTVM